MEGSVKASKWLKNQGVMRSSFREMNSNLDSAEGNDRGMDIGQTRIEVKPQSPLQEVPSAWPTLTEKALVAGGPKGSGEDPNDVGSVVSSEQVRGEEGKVAYGRVCMQGPLIS
jgi:hypothetical protein